MLYEAFLSYKHDGSLPVAERLARALRSYARPLFRIPPKIFRDEDHLVPDTDLPQSIRRALLDSRFLILLASPGAAGSRWVQEELQYWCVELGRIDRLIIVLTSGTIAYDECLQRIDWSRTDALPALLETYLSAIPLFVDLTWTRTAADLDLAHRQFKHAVNAISARLRNIDPAEMLEAEHQQALRNRRYAALAGCAFALLMGAAVYSGATAWQNGREAESRRLAAQSMSASNTDPTLALERAIWALEIADTFEA